jgi:hypothetical protein
MDCDIEQWIYFVTCKQIRWQLFALPRVSSDNNITDLYCLLRYSILETTSWTNVSDEINTPDIIDTKANIV